MTASDDFYTLEKAAEKLEVTERYVRDQIANGSLKAYKRGKRFYILHSDLIDFIRNGKDAKDKTAEG
ncbi:MAG: helix-turn-helix domain-containing protein [Saprospiraceae bacterium]|nr:helix-turn-helix domain-containing protein [Saprospiraceae bacterium]